MTWYGETSGGVGIAGSDGSAAEFIVGAPTMIGGSGRSTPVGVGLDARATPVGAVLSAVWASTRHPDGTGAGTHVSVLSAWAEVVNAAAVPNEMTSEATNTRSARIQPPRTLATY